LTYAPDSNFLLLLFPPLYLLPGLLLMILAIFSPARVEPMSFLLYLSQGHGRRRIDGNAVVDKVVAARDDAVGAAAPTMSMLPFWFLSALNRIDSGRVFEPGSRPRHLHCGGCVSAVVHVVHDCRSLALAFTHRKLQIRVGGSGNGDKEAKDGMDTEHSHGADKDCTRLDTHFS
jgi:hypothetical protein